MAIPDNVTGIRRRVMRLYHLLLPKPLRPRSMALSLIRKRADGRVLSGPFKGMRYPLEATDFAWPQKILGTYESEIHATLGELFRQSFRTFVDVGAAEGYYITGVARVTSIPRLVAFETRPEARGQLAALLSCNGIESSRVELRAECTCEQLNEVVNAEWGTLILMDVDGAETTLLEPALVPSLRNATLVVEMHEHFAPGAAKAIRSRFEGSHTIHVVHQSIRTIEQSPARSRLLDHWIESWMHEHRSFPHEWWLLQPRATSAATPASR